MRRPENDAQLAGWAIAVQKLASSLDQVTRDKGVRGVAEVWANITAVAREGEWRCNKILENKNGD